MVDFKIQLAQDDGDIHRHTLTVNCLILLFEARLWAMMSSSEKTFLKMVEKLKLFTHPPKRKQRNNALVGGDSLFRLLFRRWIPLHVEIRIFLKYFSLCQCFFSFYSV